jgi:nitrate reductase gamma subunit
MYPLLGAVIALGIVNTIGVNLLGLGGHAGGYDYRSTVAVWFRDVLMFHPSTSQMLGAPWSFQVHALLALVLLAAWPFTRLVHVLAAPIGYAFRPYIVYRTREPQGASRLPRTPLK